MENTEAAIDLPLRARMEIILKGGKKKGRIIIEDVLNLERAAANAKFYMEFGYKEMEPDGFTLHSPSTLARIHAYKLVLEA